jgi:hypothetical protein
VGTLLPCLQRVCRLALVGNWVSSMPVPGSACGLSPAIVLSVLSISNWVISLFLSNGVGELLFSVYRSWDVFCPAMGFPYIALLGHWFRKSPSSVWISWFCICRGLFYSTGSKCSTRLCQIACLAMSSSSYCPNTVWPLPCLRENVIGNFVPPNMRNCDELPESSQRAPRELPELPETSNPQTWYKLRYPT